MALADLSRCFLHTLGDSEKSKLEALRKRLPELIAKARERSEDAKAMKILSIWGIDLEKENEASDTLRSACVLF